MKTPEEFAEAMKGKGTYTQRRQDAPFVLSGATPKKPHNISWPEISNVEQAVQASNMGASAAIIIAAVNAIVATISIVKHTNIVGVNGAGYVDATLFALCAWGIYRRSKLAAIAGLALFATEKVYQFATQPKALLGLGLALCLMLFLISGVRGTFGYHRFTSKDTLKDVEPKV
ncbi:hypothetical protein [Dyella flagellata]|uniref:Uncharacterized protein n=1 Tax=Dyella flagellata TaxID=1867833 RepID=A0ABQ5X9B2_9GAMM|nr:hypothetical protein [Dyella flagellata]GLQ88256.1 hypothetical protein GCM10007898_18250 [Dyella flagellata]